MDHGGGRVSAPAWLAERRLAAGEEARALGVPGPSLEEWKYTDGTALLAEPAGELPVSELEALIAPWILPEACARLVFLDGAFQSALSALPEGAAVLPLALALDRPEASALGESDPAGHAFFRLALERWSDGLYLHLPAGAKLPGPVQLFEVGAGSAWLRHLAVLGEGAKASVSHLHLSRDGAPSAARSAFEVDLAPGSELVHERFVLGGDQSALWNALSARVRRDARLVSRTTALGGALSRLEVHASLVEPGASAELRGLVSGAGREKVDAYTSVRHASPDCVSDELWKNLAGGASQASFHGQVWVDPDAQRTAARQSNRNILLSREAAVNSRPQLEIWADDVKCSHGSATGRLDEKALFFLRSRGLGPEAAKAILVRAFAGELLEGLEHESLKDAARDRLETRL